MSIKKMSAVVLLAFAGTMLFAGTALAAHGDNSNYTVIDGSGTTTNTLDPYANWTILGSNVTVQTPHRGYTTTTIKCATCHAVHRAPAAGQILLRDEASNACSFCHITDAISSVIVYGADDTWYTTDSLKNHDGVDGGSDCVDCHAVHGANTITSTQVSTKILRASTGTVPGGDATIPDSTFTDNGADRDALISRFCTQCHPYYEPNYDDDATDYNHVMGDSGGTLATYGNTVASTTVQGTQVAWAASVYCTSCHDAGTDTQDDNFPHYTSGARFLLSAAFSGDTTAAAADPSEDGACIKCHKGAANTGVGYSY